MPSHFPLTKPVRKLHTAAFSHRLIHIDVEGLVGPAQVPPLISRRARATLLLNDCPDRIMQLLKLLIDVVHDFVLKAINLA